MILTAIVDASQWMLMGFLNQLKAGVPHIVGIHSITSGHNPSIFRRWSPAGEVTTRERLACCGRIWRRWKPMGKPWENGEWTKKEWVWTSRKRCSNSQNWNLKPCNKFRHMGRFHWQMEFSQQRIIFWHVLTNKHGDETSPNCEQRCYTTKLTFCQQRLMNYQEHTRKFSSELGFSASAFWFSHQYIITESLRTYDKLWIHAWEESSSRPSNLSVATGIQHDLTTGLYPIYITGSFYAY